MSKPKKKKFAVLPKIDVAVEEEFGGDLRLIRDGQWTEEAVDFAAFIFCASQKDHTAESEAKK